MKKAQPKIVLFGVRSLPPNIQEHTLLQNIEKMIDLISAEIKLVVDVIEVSFVDEEAITEINYETRDISSSTDVLSFEAGKLDREKIAEVYVCYPVIEAKMSEVVHDVTDEEFLEVVVKELIRMLIHGLLHTNGYDHSTELEYGYEDDNPEAMFIEQERILKIILKTYQKSN